MRSATAEAAAKREALARAEAALSRYIATDSGSPKDPPRLLRYILEDDPRSRALEAEIGLVGRARRLFEAVDDILQTHVLDASPGKEALPERIVIYIDDLDRCSHDKVYAVLQAVHLLLAFKSFIVVVGVDPTWVQASLENAIKTASGETDHEGSKITSRAEHYLEKIFQLAIWLKPLEANSTTNSTFRSLVTALSGPPTTLNSPVLQSFENKVPDDARIDEVVDAALSNPPVPSDLPPSSAQVIDNRAVSETPDIQRQERSWMALSEAEVQFLSGSLIGNICAPTPRATKRLVNTYRVLRNLVSGSTLVMPLEGAALHAALGLATAIATSARTGMEASAMDVFKQCGREELVRDIPSIVTFAVLSNDFSEPKDRSAFLELLRNIDTQDQTAINDLKVGQLLNLIKFAKRFAIRFPT